MEGEVEMGELVHSSTNGEDDLVEVVTERAGEDDLEEVVTERTGDDNLED